MGEYPLKKLISLILGIIGVFLLIFILVKLGGGLFSESFSEEQKQANSIASAIEFLKSPGDFTNVPVGLDKDFFGFVLEADKDIVKFDVYPKVEQQLTGPVIDFSNPVAGKIIDVPVCVKDKISSKPCVEGSQKVSIKELSGSIFLYEENADIFKEIRRKAVKTPKKSVTLFVSGSGRILLLAPDPDLSQISKVVV